MGAASGHPARHDRRQGQSDVPLSPAARQAPSSYLRPTGCEDHRGGGVKMTTKIDVEPIVRRPYTIEFEYPDDPDEGVLAYVAEWPDCFAAGRTREEAVQELGKVMRELASYRLRRGLPLPPPTAAYTRRPVSPMPKGLPKLPGQRPE